MINYSAWIYCVFYTVPLHDVAVYYVHTATLILLYFIYKQNQKFGKIQSNCPAF